MHDAARVRGGERLGDIDRDLEAALRPERALLAQDRLDAGAEQVLHDDEARVGVEAGVVDRDDARVRQGGGGARLALEALHADGVAVGELGGEHLHGDGALEHEVGGAIDGAHTAAADDREQLVSPGEGSVRDRHLRGSASRRRLRTIASRTCDTIYRVIPR